MNVKVLCEKDIRKCIDREQTAIDEIISLNGPTSLANGLLINDVVQKYICDNSCDEYHKILKPLILDSVIRSEHGSGGSGPVCLNIIADQLSYMSNKMRAGYKTENIKLDQKRQISAVIDEIKKSSRKLNKLDVYNLIDKNFDLKIQEKISKTIVDNSNIKSPIFLERSEKRETILSFSSGYNFEIPIDAEILSKGASWERNNVKVLIIDGMIESIGEIHHILEKAASEKNPTVMFVRSMADDVRLTLKLNIKRGTIDLIPVEVGFNEETINILNDIAICCNSDIISTHKGDLISTSGIIDLITVRKITITSKGINIINDASEDILASHLKYLEEKRNLSPSPEINSMFDKRVRSLSSGKILIRIGDDLLRLDPQSMEKFDKFFRELRTLVSYGVIYKSGVSNSVIEHTLLDGYPYSPASIFFATKHAFSTILNIFSINLALIEDNV